VNDTAPMPARPDPVPGEGVTEGVSRPRRGRTPKRRARRADHHGAVIRRSDGRWAGRLKMPDGTTRWFYRKSQGAVEAALKDALDQLGTGVPLPNAKLTMGAWLREWMDSLQVTGPKRKGLKASTVDYYRRYCEKHLLGDKELSQKPLAKVEAADLARLYRRMTSDKAEGGLGLSSTSAHHLHAIVHRALAKAFRQGKVARNVADLVDDDDRPAVATTEMIVLAGKDYDTFLAAIRGERLEALFVVAIREGLRQGEILGLRWRDVHLDDGRLSVTGSLQGARRSALTIAEPKTKRSRRSLELFPQTVDALREHQDRQHEERRVAASVWEDRDLVFPNEFGGYLSTTTLTRRLDAILNDAGLPDVRFHDLRHSAATDWLRNEMHPKVASERLGHASVGITLDLYSHVTPTMQKEAVASVARNRSARRERPEPLAG